MSQLSTLPWSVDVSSVFKHYIVLYDTDLWLKNQYPIVVICIINTTQVTYKAKYQLFWMYSIHYSKINTGYGYTVIQLSIERRWWSWRRIKFVVFIHSYRNMPSTSYSLGDYHKISCAKFYKFWWPFGKHFHLAFEQVTCFFCVIFKRILPRRTAPSDERRKKFQKRNNICLQQQVINNIFIYELT